VVGLPENESHGADKALRYFHATCLSEAAGPARNAIASAARCRCCSHVIAQRFERIGSTLFYDDDPRTLIQAFDSTDRDACTLKLLAACIVLYGRERTAVH
jgi:hypothetical protein